MASTGKHGPAVGDNCATRVKGCSYNTKQFVLWNAQEFHRSKRLIYMGQPGPGGVHECLC